MFDFADDNAIFLQDSPHRAIVGFFDPVRVLYDVPFSVVENFQMQAEGTAPACIMSDADVAALDIAHGTNLTIMKKETLVGDFEVVGIQPDGLGFTRLVLTEAP